MKSNKVIFFFSLLALYASNSFASDTSCNRYDSMLPKGPQTPTISSACDTLYPEWGGVRKDMADSGFYVQAQLLSNLTYDVAGNWKNEPNYVGQRLTTGTVFTTDLTYDLSRLGFGDGAQLYISGAYLYNNFKSIGQDGHAYIGDFWITQPVFTNRIIARYGYSLLLNNFYGLYLGTSSASSALGPTSVMLSQAGLTSLKPSPSAELTFYSENYHWYDHIGVARSQSTDGMKADSKYNTYGLRWSVPNSGTLVINEIGYKVSPGQEEHMKWFRVGSVFNKSPFFNYNSELYDDSSYSHYIAGTYQITQTDKSAPHRGWYIDGKSNYAPAEKSLYNADFSLSVFSLGPFVSRPDDMLSFGISYNKFSTDAKDYFERNGGTSEEYSMTASASYSLKLHSGLYWTNQLSYTHHPAITAKEDDAYNILTQIVINI
ncbi:TPA: carbohydrate porin [Klebsiella oxytoca]